MMPDRQFFGQRSFFAELDRHPSGGVMLAVPGYGLALVTTHLGAAGGSRCGFTRLC